MTIIHLACWSWLGLTLWFMTSDDRAWSRISRELDRQAAEESMRKWRERRQRSRFAEWQP